MTINSKSILPGFTAAGFAAMLAGAFALPTAAAAHPHSEDKKVERIVIVDSDKEKAEGRVRTVRILHSDRKCEGESTKVEESTRDKERTRLVLCHKDNSSPAERAGRLEKALSRIRSDEHLSAEHKAKVETALQEAIAKLRATN